jgi:peroxiredoxin
VAQLRLAHERIKQAGLELVIIGSGTPAQAKAFASSVDFSGPLYVDQKLEAYAAAGMNRGVARTYSAFAVVNVLRAFFGGFRQGKTHGDPWQQGGVLIVTPDGRVPFRHADPRAGAHADMAALLAAVESVSAHERMTLTDGESTIRHIPKGI